MAETLAGGARALAMFAAAALCGAAAAAENGLVARWAFDEASGPVAACTEGDGADGALSPAMKWVTGPFGSALAFSGGKDSTVQFAEFPSAICGAESCTIALWARWNGEGRGKWPSLLSSVGWYDRGFMFFVNDGSASFRIRGEEVGGKVREASGLFLGKIPSEKWTHLAMTFARPDVTLYADGRRVASVKWDGRFPSTKGFLLGKSFNETCHDGFVDDLRIYSRALSAKEVEALASDGAHEEIEGYQDDGTGGVEPVRFHGQEMPVAVTLKGDAATLAIDAGGGVASLKDRASGRELAGGLGPFAVATLADGAWWRGGA